MFACLNNNMYIFLDKGIEYNNKLIYMTFYWFILYPCPIHVYDSKDNYICVYNIFVKILSSLITWGLTKYDV